jgi:hypothetical protein
MQRAHGAKNPTKILTVPADQAFPDGQEGNLESRALKVFSVQILLTATPITATEILVIANFSSIWSNVVSARA